MKDNTPSLEVKEDGQIWLNDGRQSILVSNQEVAKELIWTERTGLPFAEPITIKPGIYPIPDLKWEVVAKPVQIGFEKWDQMRVAVISIPESNKEQRKKLLIEMMQEDEKNGMYEATNESQKELRRLVYNIASSPYQDFIKEMKKFHITRKPE